MAVGYGMRGHLLWDFQNSYGTTKTTSQQALAITTEGLVHSIEDLIEKNMYGRFGESPYHEGKHMVQGDVTFDANPHGIGMACKAALSLVSTTSAAGTQTHVFRARTADFDDRAAQDPITLEINRDVGSASVYYDCLANNLALNISNGELLTCTLGFMGAGFSRKASGSPTYPVASPFLWSQFSGSFNSAAIVDLKNINISYNNALEASYTLVNCKTPYRIKRTAQQKLELSGTFVFASHSYWQAFDAKSENQIVMNFAGAQTPNQLTIDIPSVRFKTFEPKMAGTGLIEASFTAEGIFNVNSNNAMTITLINTQTYY